jgi:hypothetical protein
MIDKRRDDRGTYWWTVRNQELTLVGTVVYRKSLGLWAWWYIAPDGQRSGGTEQVRSVAEDLVDEQFVTDGLEVAA